MKIKLILSIFLSLLLFSCQEPIIDDPNKEEPDVEKPKPPVVNPEKPDDPDEPASTSLAFVKGMGVGWNLGNTLDTKNSDKTYWGNPETTRELIDAVKAKGFKTLRVPITWQFNMSMTAPDYTIQSTYLDRVEEIVNYGLRNDMYVIVNIHHDEDIISPTYAKYDQSEAILKSIWTQVATRFKEYDNKLIFENFNEMRVVGSAQEWNGGTEENRDCINKFHAAIVKAVRAVGGKNTDRYLMVAPYAASTAPVAIDALVLPKDDHLIVAVHSYSPYNFAMNANGTASWGTSQEKRELDAEMDKIYNKFIARNIAVVMGEWGSINKNNVDARIAHASYYVSACRRRGICPVWWDNGIARKANGKVADTYGLINRSTYRWEHDSLASAIVDAQ